MEAGGSEEDLGTAPHPWLVAFGPHLLKGEGHCGPQTLHTVATSESHRRPQVTLTTPLRGATPLATPGWGPEAGAHTTCLRPQPGGKDPGRTFLPRRPLICSVPGLHVAGVAWAGAPRSCTWDPRKPGRLHLGGPGSAHSLCHSFQEILTCHWAWTGTSPTGAPQDCKTACPETDLTVQTHLGSAPHRAPWRTPTPGGMSQAHRVLP